MLLSVKNLIRVPNHVADYLKTNNDDFFFICNGNGTLIIGLLFSKFVIVMYFVRKLVRSVFCSTIYDKEILSSILVGF